MRIVCVPENLKFATSVASDHKVILYGHAAGDACTVGATARHVIQRRGLQPAARAWDLFSIALSVAAADTIVRRDKSPDGWTRQIELDIAVSDLAFWTAQQNFLSRMLEFLTTDIWQVTFIGGPVQPVAPKLPAKYEQDCVVLLSGGLDSLIGAIDLVKKKGKNPLAVSQISRGDKQKQRLFASKIGGGLSHLQLNHNADCPSQNERSQRARSIIFLTYGVLAATALKRYHEGRNVPLFVCENGFISINPPLTDARLGSLSTRTTHPFFIRLFQELLGQAGLRVTFENPYQFKTKGEMLRDCADQAFLREYAHTSTSCGRFARNAYRHCGRCLPCLIRRSAFYAWNVKDSTPYVFVDLSRDDKDHARFDDVRAAALAITAAKTEGLSKWTGPALSSALLYDVNPYKDVIGRGLGELGIFLDMMGVK